MKIKIIQISPDRWQEYRDLRIQALKECPQSFLSTPEEAMKESAEFWQKKSKTMFFAEVEGKLVGMIGGYQDEKQKLEHTFNIVSFYVASDFRHQGVGRALFQHILDYAQQKPEVEKYQLGVAHTQSNAIKLYESFGFVIVGTMKDHIKVGDQVFDKHVMEKYLD